MKMPSQKIFIINKVKRIRKWTKEEDNILLYYSEVYESKQWNKVAEFMKERTQNQCLARYMRLKPGIKKGFWSGEEDDLLIKAVKEEGKSWGRVCKYFKNRTGKQCRDRYLNHLDPTTCCAKFSQEEDQKILELYQIYGNSWCLIAKHMTIKRTPERIKNRFYSSLYKLIHKEDYIKNCDSKSKKSTSGDTNSKCIYSNEEEEEQNKISEKFHNDNLQLFNLDYINNNYIVDDIEMNCISNYFCLQ